MVQFGPLNQQLGADARPHPITGARTQPGPNGEFMTEKQMCTRYGTAGPWHWMRSSDHLRGYRAVPGSERLQRLREYLRSANGPNASALGVVSVPDVSVSETGDPVPSQIRRPSYQEINVSPSYRCYWSEDDAATVSLRMYEELSGVLWAPLGPLLGPDGQAIPYNPDPRDTMVMALPPTERCPLLRWERNALVRNRFYDWERENPLRAAFKNLKTPEDLYKEGFFKGEESSSSEDEANEPEEGFYETAKVEEYSVRRLRALRRMILATDAELDQRPLWVTPGRANRTHCLIDTIGHQHALHQTNRRLTEPRRFPAIPEDPYIMGPEDT